VSKQYWRLLEPGDVYMEGDEFLEKEGTWETNSVRGYTIEKSVVGRRRITLPEPQGWISVKERMPTKEDGRIIWASIHGGRPVGVLPNFEYTHWMALPTLTLDPDEEAFNQWWGNTPVGDRELAKRTFISGRKSVVTEGGAK
jgi:hypothetical protein